MDLGLDFGTTHTVVALSDRGNYPVVAFHDEHGDAHDHFPTVVADDDGALVYGFSALEAARRGAPRSMEKDCSTRTAIPTCSHRRSPTACRTTRRSPTRSS